MKNGQLGRGARVAATCVVVMFGVAGCGMMPGGRSSQQGGASGGATQAGSLRLSGAEEVPPVTTSATGTGSITVRPDRSVSGSITTSGINATMAHIHQAPRGTNGPVIVPLTKSGENTWAVPSGSTLTEAQYDAYKAGNLYVNVHSAAFPGGELRAQLRP